MAIRKTITLDSGITVPDAYIRIDTVSGYKGHIDAVAYGYLSREAFLGEAPYSKPQGYVVGPVPIAFTPDIGDGAPEIFTQAYGALKLLTEFADCVDC